MSGVRNIPLKKLKKFLEKSEGCKCIRIKGGHYIYARKDLPRSFPIQTHVDPVPLFIVKNVIRWLGYTTNKEKQDFIDRLLKY